MIVIEGKRRPVEALAFHPDGTRLVVGGGENTWTLFRDATTGRELTRWPVNPVRIPHNIAFHPSGRWLFSAVGDRGLYVVDVQSNFISEYKPEVYGLAVSPTGERLIVKGIRDRIASLRVGEKSLPASEWTVDVGREWWSQCLAFFSDGKTFASGEYREYGEPENRPDEARLCIRSATDGSLLAELGSARGTPFQVAVSPDGEWVALRAGIGLVAFEVAKPGAALKLEGPNKKHPTAIAFHPSGRYLAVASRDGSVRLHDRDANWTVTRTFDWKIGALKSVAFNADGTLAVAGGESGKVVVWDVDV